MVQFCASTLARPGIPLVLHGSACYIQKWRLILLPPVAHGDVSQNHPMHLRAVPKGACVSEDRVPGAYVLAAPGDTGMTHQGSGQCPCNVSGPIWS